MSLVDKTLRQAAVTLLERLADQGVRPTGVSDDSRLVQPGDLFVAYPGALSDGRNFALDAVARGAVGVVWEPSADVHVPYMNVPHIEAANLRAMVGWLAHAVAGWPTDQMPLLAVTGTNGKTTVSQWLARLYPRRCGVIGTLGAGFAGEEVTTGFTTPEATTLVRWLQSLRAQGATACALEASSIGIEEGRMNGLHIDTAIFTNFTRDHLDYHGTMEAYAEAKARLFDWPRLRFAVINLDDPMGPVLMRRTNAAKVVGYTLSSERVNFPAVIRAEQIEDTRTGQRFVLNALQGRVSIETSMVGRYNVSNLLAVAAVLLDAGVPVREVGVQLSRLKPPPGRMEVYGGQDDLPLVVVDYAHTPDALENALQALRPLSAIRGGSLTVIFGCGGDRDPGKRPLMGEVAARLADQVVLTTDNPRHEDPREILAAIHVAVPQATVEADRTQAILSVVAQASPATVILIAGKGHEAYQEIAGVQHPFQDGEVVQRALELRQLGTAQPDVAEVLA